jgi:alkylation response protein AidB-like acyl-CoA dehydrogenase
MSRIRPQILHLLDQLQQLNIAHLPIEERIGKLVELKIHSLPVTFHNMTAEEYLAVIANLAQLDASSALSLSMHLYTLWGIATRQGETFSGVLDDVSTHGHLMGSLNEPGLYFLTPGQLNIETYPIRARKVEGGYRVTGLKKFVSLEPFVSYLPVYCMVENYSGNDLGVIALMLSKNGEGVSVVEDWNSVAMQDTHSNSVKFDNAFCPDAFVICDENTPISTLAVQGYLFRFNVCCVYLGISRQVLDLAINTASTKCPPNGNNVLAKYPGVQFSIAEMLISMEVMESQMRSFCSVLDDFLASKEDVDLNVNRISLIAKEVIARESELLVSSAMKITGINSLSNENPLSSIFKDIKAAQFHPPQRDVTYEILAKEKLGVISYKQRWM